MEGTRLQILDTLQRNGHATVHALARTLELAPATIRRHLDILQRDRLIAFQEVKKPTGRPEYAFFLTEAGHEVMPKDYHRLLGSLVTELTSLRKDEIQGHDGKEILETILRRLAQRTAERAQGSAAGDLNQRIAALTTILQEEHFQPDVEYINGSIRIKLFNCPFRSVAMEHDSICSLDSHLISTVLGAEVSLEKCVASGDSSCCYLASYNQTSP